MDVRIRPAESADVDDVIGFTRDTWTDRDAGDYLPDVFPRWVETEDPDRHTLVADVDGQAVGTLQAVRLSTSEAWLQGLRVHPEHRGEGIGTRLVRAGFSWALSTVTRERLRRAAARSLLVIEGDDPRGVAYRARTHDHEADGDMLRWAEYGVAAWTDADACGALMAAIARDAASVDADRTRVLIPETVTAVSDVAMAGHRLSESPDFVLGADLTGSPGST